LRTTDADGAPIALEHWLDNDDLQSDVRIVTRAGDVCWLGCSYSRDRADASLVVVARDITKAKELERLKDDFVAVVSHELRTPLTTIRGFTQMLLEPSRQVTDEQRGEALAMIRKGAHRLDRLVVNLLEVSRIAARRTPTPTESIDLVAVSRQVIGEQLESWPQRTIRLTADGPVRARANEVSYEQVLGNLLSNALKYAPLSPIDVRLTEDNGSAIVTVTDDGPGIPRREHERVFERFERLAHATSQAGTGLGLYIAHQLTRAMGGDLTLESDDGQGCAFSISLPAAPHLTLVRDARAG
jgi:two-component system phosphate regulon sensor histidine kinase PhoR